jgi:hypothetical protein
MAAKTIISQRYQWQYRKLARSAAGESWWHRKLENVCRRGVMAKCRSMAKIGISVSGWLSLAAKIAVNGGSVMASASHQVQ